SVTQLKDGDVLGAAMTWTMIHTGLGVDMVVSPVTTAIDALKEAAAAVSAAWHGDWGGAAEHGHYATADTASVVATVMGGAAAVRGFTSIGRVEAAATAETEGA